MEKDSKSSHFQAYCVWRTKNKDEYFYKEQSLLLERVLNKLKVADIEQFGRNYMTNIELNFIIKAIEGTRVSEFSIKVQRRVTALILHVIEHLTLKKKRCNITSDIMSTLFPQSVFTISVVMLKLYELLHNDNLKFPNTWKLTTLF